METEKEWRLIRLRRIEAIHSFAILHSTFVIPSALPLVRIQDVAKAIPHQVKPHDND